MLNGLGWITYVRSEFNAARALAQRVHALAAAHQDPVLFVCACNLLGVTIGFQGELDAARDRLDEK